jgi:hypothetical protein
MGLATFWAIFLQTHLVTQSLRNKNESKLNHDKKSFFLKIPCSFVVDATLLSARAFVRSSAGHDPAQTPKVAARFTQLRGLEPQIRHEGCRPLDQGQVQLGSIFIVTKFVEISPFGKSSKQNLCKSRDQYWEIFAPFSQKHF